MKMQDEGLGVKGRKDRVRVRLSVKVRIRVRVRVRVRVSARIKDKGAVLRVLGQCTKV